MRLQIQDINFNNMLLGWFSGTNPPARNFGVGTGVTCLISHIPRNIHNTITSNHFARYDVDTLWK